MPFLASLDWIMPTPFTHLHIAEKMKAQLAEMDGDGPGLRALLHQFWPAFYLGQVSPDVQGVAGLSRVATHFYGVPPEPDNMAYPRMLAQFPQLADVAHMPSEQAVFVAGYSAHLLLDLVWFRDILIPFFQKPTNLGAFPQRRLLHHVLLTYLDRLAYEALPETAVSTLSAAQPHHWLPFVTDAHLSTWRDLLTVQLQPNGLLETVAVYARRLGMPPADFAAKLDDEEWMAARFFALIPVQKVQARLETAVSESIAVVQTYLQPLVQSES